VNGPPPINRLPAGLLSFLGIKNGGQYPQHLATDLLPVWNLADLYLNSSPIYDAANATFNADGAYFPLVVPQSEIWYVTDFSVWLSTGVGESAQWSLARVSQGGVDYVGLGEAMSLAASSERGLAWNRPMVLASGEGLGFQAWGGAYAGAIDYAAAIRYAKLEV